MFFGESDEMRKAREQTVQHPKETNLVLPGLTFSEALRTRTYWYIAIATYLAITVVNGVLRKVCTGCEV
jgi:hypothetical protein